MSKSTVKFTFDNKALQKTISNAISKSDFNIACPNCQNIFSVNGSQFGSSVICPSCNQSIVLNDSQLNNDIKKIKF